MKLFIAFASTAQAMKMEQMFDPTFGRLIPLPGFIQAGCGLAWMSEDLNEETWQQRLQKKGIQYEKMVISEWQ